MALQISEKKGTFYLKGKLNCSTVRSFIIHFEHCIEHCNTIVLNIDKVKEIDASGLGAIQTLMAIALRKHKMFTTIGYGSKDIYDHFSDLNVA